MKRQLNLDKLDVVDLLEAEVITPTQLTALVNILDRKAAAPQTFWERIKHVFSR
jgi:hypothetical protein